MRSSSSSPTRRPRRVTELELLSSDGTSSGGLGSAASSSASSADSRPADIRTRRSSAPPTSTKKQKRRIFEMDLLSSDGTSSGGIGSIGSASASSAASSDEAVAAPDDGFAEHCAALSIDAHGADDSKLEQRVAGVLRAHLVGPCGGAKGLRMWASTCALCVACLGQVTAARMRRSANNVQALEWEVQITLAVVGFLLMEGTVILGRACLEDSQHVPAPRHPALLKQVLSMPVSASLQRRITQHIQRSRVLVLMFAVAVIIMLRGHLEVLGGSVDETSTIVLTLLSLATLPPSFFILTGWMLFVNIPCLIVCDHIEQHTARIARLGQRGRRPSYDAIMWSLHHVHRVTTRLSALMGPTLKIFIAAMALVAIHWIAVAVTPRQDNDLNPRWKQFTGLVLLIPISVWPLSGGAKCNGACDQLVNVVACLHKDLIRSPQDVVRVDGLRRYALELNRSQGLGFTFIGKRLAADFVQSTIVRGVATVCAVLAMTFFMLSVATNRTVDKERLFTSLSELCGPILVVAIGCLCWQLGSALDVNADLPLRQLEGKIGLVH